VLNKIWLSTVRAYIKLGLFFYFKKIHIVNRANMPKDQPVLILANHQNALLDTLIIAIKCNRFSYFLTRASAFNSPFIANVLKSLRMLPVYRRRDGLQSVTKNKAIFKVCTDLFNNNESIVIFPEGNHNLKRTVRPLIKGFTRLVFNTLERYPDLDLQLVPVGFNYVNPEKFVDEVSLRIGAPIKAKDYIGFERHKGVLKLKEEVFQSITKLTTHIPGSNYDNIKMELDALHANFLNPQLINDCISSRFQDCGIQKKKKQAIIKRVFKGLLLLNIMFPYLIWNKAIAPKIKEIEFVSTFRFVVAITLVPFYLILVSIIIVLFAGWITAAIYVLAIVLLALVTVKI
tara:strand:- start:3724 stop:4758 length:1035 start_codon:yes stop_codon:yes gene_type:complete